MLWFKLFVLHDRAKLLDQFSRLFGVCFQIAIIKGYSGSQLGVLSETESESRETRRRQRGIPKLHQLGALSLLTVATKLTQFPQSHNVRSVSALASGSTTAQKYEKSVRCMKRDIRASNPPWLLKLDCHHQDPVLRLT